MTPTPRRPAPLAALCQAMPEDTPAGPWYLLTNLGARQRLAQGLAGPHPCRMCGDPIKPAHRTYFQLSGGTGPWADATLHLRCGRALRVRRFPDLDLIRPC